MKRLINIVAALLFVVAFALPASAQTWQVANMIVGTSCTGVPITGVSPNALCINSSTNQLFYPGASGWTAVSGGSSPTLVITGAVSGAVTLQSNTGTYNFNFPTTAGAVGAILTSGGGGAAANVNVWLADGAVGTLLTGAGATTIPAFSASPTISGTFTVQGGTVTVGVPGTTSGTLALSNATGSGFYSLAQAATTTTYTETTKAVAPAQGDILDYSNATGQRSSLVDVAVGQVLTSGGVGAVPVYSATPSVTSATATGTGDLVINASQGGHISSQIGAGTIPTCGTGTVTAISTDTAFRVTGATSPATVTFHTAFGAQPVCVCNDETSALGACKAVPNSNGQTVVITTTGTDTFDGICIGH